MEFKAGARFACPACPTELMVVRVPDASVAVTCGEVEMRDPAAHRPSGGHADAADGSLKLGKRYADEESGLEVLCTKPGQGGVAVDGRQLSMKGAKPLPASD